MKINKKDNFKVILYVSINYFTPNPDFAESETRKNSQLNVNFAFSTNLEFLCSFLKK